MVHELTGSDEMIDYCNREGCDIYRVSRSIDSRPLLKPWYCSRQCRDIATRPMHWQDPAAEIVSACGLISVNFSPHLITANRDKVTCRCCKQTAIWKRGGE